MNTSELRKNLEYESGTVCWQELEKHFARGVLRLISNQSNFFDLAIAIAQNNTATVSEVLADNLISEPSDSQASHWQQHNTLFLTVVVAPFVLIQESNTKSISDKT